jgi:hypothetical protein
MRPLLLTAATSAVLAFIHRTEFPLFVHGRSAARVEPSNSFSVTATGSSTPAATNCRSPSRQTLRPLKGQLLRSLLPLTSSQTFSETQFPPT